MLFHPYIDGGIPLDGAVKSQQMRFRGRFSHGAFSRNILEIGILYDLRLSNSPSCPPVFRAI
jgi:hypothetical protein